MKIPRKSSDAFTGNSVWSEPGALIYKMLDELLGSACLCGFFGVCYIWRYYLWAAKGDFSEKGRAVGNKLSAEVMAVLAATWLMLTTLLYSLQLNTGTFPKPLTEAEERHYLDLAAQGDIQARNVLIERNLRLVAHIMKKYYSQAADQEDLISIGTIGLIKGISTFDASKGTRLATYAARCAENAILTPTTLRASVLHPKA